MFQWPQRYPITVYFSVRVMTLGASHKYLSVNNMTLNVSSESLNVKVMTFSVLSGNTIDNVYLWLWCFVSFLTKCHL